MSAPHRHVFPIGSIPQPLTDGVRPAPEATPVWLWPAAHTQAGRRRGGTKRESVGMYVYACVRFKTFEFPYCLCGEMYVRMSEV